MKLVFSAALVILLNGYSDAVEPRKSLSTCQVLERPADYLGKSFVLRGFVVYFEHGAYLQAFPKCEGQEISGIRLVNVGDAAAYYDAGGRKGVGVLATVRGKVVIRNHQAPHATHVNYPVLAVEWINYEGSAPR